MSPRRKPNLFSVYQYDWDATSPHERIGNPSALQVVCLVKGLAKRSTREFGQQQAPKQGPRPPGEPLMYRDDRPVVLLDLFFPQRQIGDEGYVEVFFDYLISS
jgi:hypothetical protein